MSDHPDGEALPCRDPQVPVEARVSDLLRRMTMAEKIGQMTQLDRTVATADVVKDLFIGSVLNGGDSALPPSATPSDWADMIDSFQPTAMSTRLGIPIIYGADAVHGCSNVYGTTIFPHNIGLGAAGDEDLILRIGKATALETRAIGIPYAFAPCIAVSRDPRWGRCYESYGESPDLVERLGTKLILGLQGSPPSDHPSGYPFVAVGGKHVVACAKHFAGDGGTEGGVNESNTVASSHDFFSIHIQPYLDAIKMGVSTIMISYSSWNGVKMHANEFMISNVLKNELGFQGMVISDWEGVDRIRNPAGSDYKESVCDAINAGIDMIMVPHKYELFIPDLTDLVLSGRVSMERIDDAVRRILRVKFVAGVFDHPFADRSLFPFIGCEEHRELAREAVRKSLVLLKNGKRAEEPLLPLSKNAPKILVAGTHADNIGYQCGGWTITWAGLSGDITPGTSILQGIKNAVSKETHVVFEENPDESFWEENRDVFCAIVVVGEEPYVETKGDDKELRIPLGGAEIIQRVCNKASKCLVIIVSGRPLVIEPYIDAMDALVAAWLPGSEAGKGIADVIFGDHDFQGKLPRTWFRRVDQLPMNVGDSEYDPLFPFGFGLQIQTNL
ncbi:hypothetical protein H6P81_002151 [Aristolochia fimbriata]|uniref:Beta-glucosidase n=1 Tax=Aristolochia fimbriata TaxID=158543 RepID=A0AAV7F988_ARIFI|nr:hypothetical protein H6P81_002151 [Aristolochia fimbriata]